MLLHLFLFLFLSLPLSSSPSPSSLRSSLPSLSENEIRHLLSLPIGKNRQERNEEERRILLKGKDDGYQWNSWMFGPPCPNRTLISVPFEDVANNANVKRTLREINVDGLQITLFPFLSLSFSFSFTLSPIFTLLIISYIPSPLIHIHSQAFPTLRR